jgi:hypothetical protein
MSNKMNRKQMHQHPDQLPGLQPDIRMKGGVLYDPSLKGFVAIVHSWDNVLCTGEPKEWCTTQVFPTEETAMQYYKTNIRPEIEKMTSQMGKSGTKILHRKLEE